MLTCALKEGIKAVLFLEVDLMGNRWHKVMTI